MNAIWKPSPTCTKILLVKITIPPIIPVTTTSTSLISQRKPLRDEVFSFFLSFYLYLFLSFSILGMHQKLKTFITKTTRPARVCLNICGVDVIQYIWERTTGAKSTLIEFVSMHFTESYSDPLHFDTTVLDPH